MTNGSEESAVCADCVHKTGHQVAFKTKAGKNHVQEGNFTCHLGHYIPHEGFLIKVRCIDRTGDDVHHSCGRPVQKREAKGVESIDHGCGYSHGKSLSAGGVSGSDCRHSFAERFGHVRADKPHSTERFLEKSRKLCGFRCSCNLFVGKGGRLCSELRGITVKVGNYGSLDKGIGHTGDYRSFRADFAGKKLKDTARYKFVRLEVRTRETVCGSKETAADHAPKNNECDDKFCDRTSHDVIITR